MVHLAQVIRESHKTPTTKVHYTRAWQSILMHSSKHSEAAKWGDKETCLK